MAQNFTINVFQNRAVGTRLLANHWGQFAEGLKFGTNAFGGYGTCTFSLRFRAEQLMRYLVGYGSQPTYVTNRIRIVDPLGIPCYEGMIYALSLKLGNEVIARSAENLFNCVRADFQTSWGSHTQNNTYYVDDAASRALFGKKVKRLELPGTYNPFTLTAATGQAQRFLTLHKTPQDPQATVVGGSNNVLKMDVSCVGQITPGLEWRFAFSNLTKQADTAEIIKDMILPGSISEGNQHAKRGRANSGWVELLNTGGTLAFAQQFLSTDTSHIANSGVSIERNSGSGGSRIDIAKHAAGFGSNNQRRMLLQVWDDGQVGDWGTRH
jgi:hypothetical protein